MYFYKILNSIAYKAKFDMLYYIECNCRFIMKAYITFQVLVIENKNIINQSLQYN